MLRKVEFNPAHERLLPEIEAVIQVIKRFALGDDAVVVGERCACGDPVMLCGLKGGAPRKFCRPPSEPVVVALRKTGRPARLPVRSQARRKRARRN